MRSHLLVMRSRSLLLIIVVACSPGAVERSYDAAPAPVIDAAPPPPEPVPPPFEAEVRSLELKRSIAVRMAPSEHAERYGTIAAGTRVSWKRVAEGDGCSRRWVEIEPYGWICETYLTPSKRLPAGVELPRLEGEEVVPGVYGKVTAEAAKVFTLEDELMVEARALTGSVMVRRHAEHLVDDTLYWRISSRGTREYLPASAIREFKPSQFHGVRLGDDTGRSLPLGFPMAKASASARVPVYSAAVGGRVVGSLRAREPVPVLETLTSGEGQPVAYRVGDGQWARAAELRVAHKVAPPSLTGPTERWIDIDLDEQVLVAYEGELPVYATLVATGSRQNPTEAGMYRIWVKFAETDMSDLAGEDPYSVATVPWTQFYAKDLALHTAYWHDTFGTRRSHGCANLSPMDARFLYFWSEPEVPPGWTMAKGTVERPGSIVRLRSKDVPEPAMQGYAVRVHEARAAHQARGE